jgi:hypothetical protein
MRRRPIRVIQLPISNGYHVSSLHQALLELGIRAECWELRSDFDGVKADRTIYSKRDGILKREFKRLSALNYIFHADLVIFNFGSSLFSPKPLSDLRRTLDLKDSPIGRLLANSINAYLSAMQLIELMSLRVLRRKIAVVYHGDDARQLDRFTQEYGWNYGELVGAPEGDLEGDRLKRNQIRRLSKFAHGIFVLTPDLIPMVPGSKWIPAAVMPKQAPKKSEPLEHRIVVGHAPSHRGIKGTQHVLRAVENCLTDGINLDFRLIEGVSHSDSLAALSKLDVVIDQVCIGWYGVLAVEAALQKACVMVYLDEKVMEYAKDSPEFRKIPFISASSDSLTELMIAFSGKSLRDRSLLAQETLEYALEVHSPQRVASHFLSLLNVEALTV